METDQVAVAERPARPQARCRPSQVVIETRNLSKIYRDFWGRKKVHALKALDIEVRKGEIFGLLGPNGSGKSTTIKLILGLLFPTSGRVLVFDKDATETRKNERIGYLPGRIVPVQILDRRRDARFLRPSVQHVGRRSRADASTS